MVFPGCVLSGMVFVHRLPQVTRAALKRERLSGENERSSAAKHDGAADDIQLIIARFGADSLGEGDRFAHVVRYRAKFLTIC